MSLDRIDDAAAEMRAFAMNMRRDDTEEWGGNLLFYVEAIECFADRFSALAAGSRRAKTPKAVECKASQSGGASRNAQSTPLEKNEEKRRGV